MDLVLDETLRAHHGVRPLTAVAAALRLLPTTLLGFPNNQRHANRGLALMTQVGQYRLLDKLGSSVLGAVYRAQDMATGSTVALKVLQLGLLDDVSSADMDARLQREFAAVARLIHPGIARVYDIRRDGKTALIAEELVDGPSITAFAAAQGGFDVTQAVTAVVQILEALEFAHRRAVIHQDLKPSNVLVSHDSRTKITDFGMAKLAARKRDDTGMLVGSVEYMAPEQLLGRPIDKRCDIHAAGAILYQLLTGKSPFADAHNFAMPKAPNLTPPPPSSVKDGLTGAFDRVVARALARAPADRFASARAFRDDLCAAYSGLRGRMPPETLAPVRSAPHWVASDPDATRPLVGMAAAPPAATRGKPPGAPSAPSAAARVRPLPGRREYQRKPVSVRGAATAHVSSLTDSDATTPLARREGPEPPAATAMHDLPERAPAPVPPKGPPVDLGPDSTRSAAAPSQPPDVVAPVAAERGGTQAIRGATPSPVSGQPVSRRGVRMSSAAVNKPLTDASIALGGRVLARFMGPIATVYSRKAAQEAHDERAYFERLAAHLADPKERADFLRALRRPS